MKIKIISTDGLIANAKVVNAETGEPIEGVVRVLVSLDASNEAVEASIKFKGIPVEIATEIKES